MSVASGIRAGRAFVELSADDSKLRAGLDKVRGLLSSFSSVAGKGGLGAVLGGSSVLAGMGGMATMASDVGSALKDASDRTGIAVEALSGLDYAARMSDTSLDSLVGGVFKLQKALGSVTDKKNPFKDLGLDAAALAAMKPDEAFIAVADALASISNPAERNAAAMKVFGKGAADLIPLLASGANGISGMMSEADRLGLVMSSADASQLEEFGDRIETIGMQVKRVFVEIGTAVAIAVKPYADLLSEALGMAVVIHASRPRLPASALSPKALRYRRHRERLEAAAAAPGEPQNAALLEAHRLAHCERYARRKARGDRHA